MMYSPSDITKQGEEKKSLSNPSIYAAQALPDAVARNDEKCCCLINEKASVCEIFPKSIHVCLT